MATADQESEFAESLLQNLESHPLHPPRSGPGSAQTAAHQQQRRKPTTLPRPGGHPFGGNPGAIRGNGQQQAPGVNQYADTWEEYEQMMGGLEAAGGMIPVQYAHDGTMYSANEADFVQSFVGNTQFLPYQQPGYFQHPGFTSQLYADGRQVVFPPNQMYPFPQQFAQGGQVMMISPENFHQLQAFNGQMQFVTVDPQSGAAAPGLLDPTALTGLPLATPGSVMFDGGDDSSGVVNGVGKLSIKQDDGSKPAGAAAAAKKPSGPRSWADIANAPAAPPPPKPVVAPKPAAAAASGGAPAPAMRSSVPGASAGGAAAKLVGARPDGKATGKGSGVLQVQPGTSTVNLNPSSARFFVIKSYSEDDVHKSIKYNIWASTDSGNRRLDQAWKESHDKGPIYLFFSVNGSGQFCGMAEMISAVDYTTKSDVWAQDKWNGKFQVKWHFVKDVPNQALRNIRLENNENKPVTNSRDTQEIFFEPGREMLKIVATFKSRTSIMDDFSWYDKRQEELKAKKTGGDESPDAKPAPPPPTLATAASVAATPAARTESSSSGASSGAGSAGAKTVKFAAQPEPGKKASVIEIPASSPAPASAAPAAAAASDPSSKKKGNKK